MNDYFNVMGLNDTFTGVPITAIDWPRENIGLPQVRSYNAQAPGMYSEQDVLDGPGVRRLTSPMNSFVWNVEFICKKAQAQAFEGFYVDTILNGLLWFNMPLSFATGLHDCVVREVSGSPYQMVRIGPHFGYTWTLEGFKGPLLAGEPPPIPIPPLDPIIDTIDGSDAAASIVDFNDGGDATSNFIDNVNSAHAKQ